MNLPIPTVGSEAGPQYAFDINSSLTLIDSHDHSPGRGVQITPAGININSALQFNNNPALNLSYESFTAGSSATPVLQAISVAPASSINELFYTDSNGTQTQITKNGNVNAVASSIPGESYNAGTFIWTQTQSSAPTTPANFNIGSITLSPNTAATTNGVVLGPPTGISRQFNINLPFQPSLNPAFVTIDTSGNMASTVSTAGGITGSNIGNQTITGANIANQTITATQVANSTLTNTQMIDAVYGGQQGITPAKLDSYNTPYFATSSSSGAVSYSSTSFTPVTNMTVTLPNATATRPRFICFTSTTAGGFIFNPGVGLVTATFRIVGSNGANSATIYQVELDVSGSGNRFPPGILNTIDMFGVGPGNVPWITYRLDVSVLASQAVAVENILMNVVQL